MWEAVRGAWPWWVGGPLIGLFVPLLLVLGNKQFGMSSSLRAICAAVAPGRTAFFQYDWKSQGLWNVALALGVLVGAAVTVAVSGILTPAVSPATREAVTRLGVHTVAGLVPTEVFNWHGLLTMRGLAYMLGGGFLAGFGSSYAGGCTSGHGVMGLASRQLASLIAIVGIFAGGLVATFILMPALE